MPWARAGQANTCPRAWRRTGMNTPTPGLFSRFGGARQRDRAGAKGARSWHRSSAHRGVGAEGLVDPVQSPPFTSQKLHCALEVPGTSLPLLTWDLRMLQAAGNLPKRCWRHGPSDPPGSWPRGPLAQPCAPHLSPGSGTPRTARRPALGGLPGAGPLPASPRGSPGAGGGRTPATSLAEGLWAESGAGSAPHLTLFWLLGD